MLRLFLLGGLWYSSVQAESVTIATFDGAKSTTLAWETVDDPVMGGQSHSNFTVDHGRRVGVWTGEVKVVPFLKAPGFCNVQSPGLYKTADFPDLSSMGGIVVRAREAIGHGLTKFNVMLMSKGARHLFKSGVYTASFALTTDMIDHFVPWSAFECSWRGQKVSWCPEISTQLKQINSIGLGTFFPGTAGPFSIEIEALSASSASNSYVNLVTFDGNTSHKWHSENDPVMGGKSSSSVEVAKYYAIFKGTTRIVPSLKAPGFTIALTEGAPLYSKFPDVSSMDGLTISARNIGNFTGYKIAFCDTHNFYRCQFQSFKADLRIPANDDFQEIFIPWTSFSNKWDAATGKHTAENPPSASSLQSITQLQIWTEAVEGDFALQFQYVRASKSIQVVMI